ncbi:D-amino-acid transaminase [Roseibium sp. CAU 1637]|uniref:Probable branched-chain-amino-acid aminotransferase n=1 Tax=Roseibium limicola TaxID=2816037 RepID=A0A939END8_9HYPH|nr:D-amino-acid transaminase [Roseibium limicola]MBO0345077.1 D-amino-acid transaminase [Roseibium limicola]
MRTVYVNGAFVPETEAKVSVFDRGFLFADAVYEVTCILDGKLVDFEGHMARLRRSLDELKMASPATDEELLAAHRKLAQVNNVKEGLIYLQVSRGEADRDFLFPPEGTAPTLVMFTQEKSLLAGPSVDKGLKVMTADDIRWRRCDIKTVQLLYASLLKNEAKANGVDDVWMVLDGMVTEGSSNNAYIVTQEGNIVTRPISNDILAGITRASLMRCAEEHQIKIEERSFTVEEAKAAKEAFTTSATGMVVPVVEIDGVALGDGKPGQVAKRLREIFIQFSREKAI